MVDLYQPMQPPGNTAPTRWVILHTPLGPCIHDSVVIGSLSDLRSQQNWDASSVTSMAIKICMDTHYPIYILQVECEAFEYLWNRSLVRLCTLDTGLYKAL